MNKFYLLASGVLVLVLIIPLFFWQKVGNVAPALLPPRQDISEIVPFPLSLPDGFEIGVFAKNLGNARDLEFSPDGTLLVSIPADGKVVALPDKDKNGMADGNTDVLAMLERPHGIAFHGGKLFVVEETRVVRYLWDEENLKAVRERVLFNLPKGGRHFTRSVAFDSKGQMFISLGSSCDVCSESNEWLAAVIVSNPDGENPRLWANGLRNSVFITINPETNELWGTEMGRDLLGDALPPDEVNIIRENKGYGWPKCYGNKKHDKDFDKKPFIEQVVGTLEEVRCGYTESPVYEIPAHSAPLGLTFINSSQFPKDWQGDLLVSYHGSWNSTKPVGYKVVLLDVDGDTIKGEEDFITGFLPSGGSSPSQAYGRPVDLAFDKSGSLFISDDKAGIVYKVVKK